MKNHKGHGHGHGKMMLGCLAVMMLVIMVLPRLGMEVGPLGRMAPYAIFLICPLLHIGMMVFMMKGNKKEGEESPQPEE